MSHRGAVLDLLSAVRGFVTHSPMYGQYLRTTEDKGKTREYCNRHPKCPNHELYETNNHG